MKRFFTFLTIAVVFFGFSASLISQELASRDPQPRNVVLEEYTGIHCVYCPDGHKRANALKDANPGRVVLINVHAGSFAVPSAGEPDFRTQFGEQLASFASVTGYPAGSINRMVFPGAANQQPYTPQKAGGTALSRGGWAAASKDSIFNGSISPVNIGAKTKWMNSNRELTVDLELFFTSAVEGAVKLNLVLLESHVWGPQTGGADPKNYEHNHILRHMITGQWGEQITTTGKDVSVLKTYKYTVPANIKIENCDIAVFVTKGTNQYIFTGITQPAITPDASLATTGAIIDAKKNNESFNKTFNLKNTSEREIEFAYSVEKSPRTPADWQAKLVSTEAKVKLAAGQSADIEIDLTLGATLGIGDAVLTVQELNNPDALTYSKMITAVSANAKYLEIDLGGTIEKVIKDGGRTETISLKSADFTNLASKLSPKVAVWNFGPRGEMNSSQANVILEMINKGIGVLINGSVPLPFLTFENASHPLIAKLGISWKQGDDINLQSFSLEGVKDDPIANGFKVTTTPANNGYLLQPVTITNANVAKAMIMNTDQNKTVSVRIENSTARAVYLSFNLDIIPNATEKTNLIKKAIDWIENATSASGPKITAAVSSVSFGTINKDEKSSKIIKITNDGDQALAISSITIENDSKSAFAIGTGKDIKTLAAGASAEIEVIFSPKEKANYTAQLRIQTNAGNTPDLKIALSGIGDDPSHVGEIGSKFYLNVSPNPVVSVSNVKYEINNDMPVRLSINLIDSQGNKVAELFNGISGNGTYNLNLNSANYSAGAYYLSVLVVGKLNNIPVIIVK